MTGIFWLISSVMVLMALLIILPPLWRQRDESTLDDLAQRNIKIARDRLAELTANKASGGISEAQFNEQVTELELSLSDDLEIADATKKSENQGRWLVYVLGAAIPLFSAVLYARLGDYSAINYDPSQAASQSQVGGENMPTPQAINEMVTKLAEKLKAEPENLKGWLMLGRSYNVLQKYPQAADAFSHAYQLAGDEPDVMLAYAEALSFANNSQWGGKAKELVLKALTIKPDHVTGLWFAAMLSAQQGDKQLAVDYLKKMDKALPDNSPDKQQIHDLIANAESKMGVAVPKSQTEPSAVTAVSININVSLASPLKQQVTDDDTVFIYAQALTGPKMPLAIVKKKVSDLPVSVTLTDDDSMIPSMKLSKFKQVRLLARISKSGQPMPQPGDLLGTVDEASPEEKKPYDIVINDPVK